MTGGYICHCVLLFILFNCKVSNAREWNEKQEKLLRKYEHLDGLVSDEEKHTRTSAYHNSEPPYVGSSEKSKEHRRNIRSGTSSTENPVADNLEKPNPRLALNKTKGVADMVHRFFAERAREDAYQITEAREHPYSISYLVLDKYGQANSICSGTLVSLRWVVTAAHCLVDRPVHSVKVRLSYEFFAHPRYDPHADSADHDVALIKIDPPFRTARFVRPVPMTSAPWAHAGYRTCELTAFGKVREEMSSPDDYIRKTQRLQVSKPCACGSYLEETMGADPVSRYICMKPTADFGTCYGDSGGGLICDGELKAVVSFSLPIYDFSRCHISGPSGSGECGDVDMFDIWQDLYPSLNWIKKNAFQGNATEENTTKGAARGILNVSIQLVSVSFYVLWNFV